MTIIVIINFLVIGLIGFMSGHTPVSIRVSKKAATLNARDGLSE